MQCKNFQNLQKNLIVFQGENIYARLVKYLITEGHSVLVFNKEFLNLSNINLYCLPPMPKAINGRYDKVVQYH